MSRRLEPTESLPTAQALLGVARGDDLVPLVNDLTRLLGRWERDLKKKKEIEAWEREGRRLGRYHPQGQEATQEGLGEGEDEDDEHEDRDEQQDEEPDGQEQLYEANVTGDFLEKGERTTLRGEELADLLRNWADGLEGGWVITRPSSLTIRPHQQPD